MEIRTISSVGYSFWSAVCEETVSSGVGGHGSIELEEGWQLCAVPIQYGYWSSSTHTHVHDDTTIAKFKNYILDQIEDLYGTVSGVEVANTYTGDAQAFYSYVVGSTPESSFHNFQLIYDDSGNREIAGFWIKITTTSGVVITWGEN
jgi:hypothetical protein